MNNSTRISVLLCVALYAALTVGVHSAMGDESIFNGNVTVNSNLVVKGVVSVTNNVNIVSNLTAHAISLGGQTLTNWPGINTVLGAGADAGYQVLTNLSSLVADTISVSNRVNTGLAPSGRGAFTISVWQNEIDPEYGETNLVNNEIVDFAVAYNSGDYFDDAVFGDACIRSLGATIRLGFGTHGTDEDGNPTEGIATSSLTISSNGQVSVLSGPLIITPQGDLLMGSFTNSPSH